MLSLSPGSDIRYLTDQVAGGRENYYSAAVAAGEPAGQWYGAAAEVLGLSGDVDADQMAAVYEHLLDPRDPASESPATWGEAATLGKPYKRFKSSEQIFEELCAAEPGAQPERLQELRLRANRSERNSNRFIDCTFNVQKSVSLFAVACERRASEARAVGDEAGAAQWDARVRAVEDAVMAGARAAMDYYQDVAGYHRVGHRGGGADKWADAHKWVVAQFLQHDSRDKDPHLHVHGAILNKSLGADGQWRALDGRAIFRHKGAAGAIAERTTEAHLIESLGLRFETRPDGKARELVGVTEAQRDQFSSRRRAVTKRAERMIKEFEDHRGYPPSALERSYILQQATLATRQAKSHDGETAEERSNRWAREAEESMVGSLSSIADAVLAAAQDPARPAVDRWSPTDVIDRALHVEAGGKELVTRSDVMRAISDALPAQLGLSPEKIRTLLDQMTDIALDRLIPTKSTIDTASLPDDLKLSNGRSVYEEPGAARYAMPHTQAAEKALRAAATCADRAAFTAAEADAALAALEAAGVTLGADQSAVVRGVLTSGAAIEVLSAPAGSGKSFAVGNLAQAWRGEQYAPGTPGRRVFGLATSQAAAQVLADEGLDAANLSAWIGAQARVDAGRGSEQDQHLALRRGDLVVLDEGSMADTHHVAEVNRRCDAAGAKLLLVGDPRQLAAVGAGGAMADLADRARRYELAEVRRFNADWEAGASLRLRDGDPTVVADYARHGRVVAGGTAEQTEAAARRAWLADHLAGKDTVLLVGSNEQAARTAAAIRAELVELGKVSEHGVELGRDGTIAGVGDVISARRNGWELRGFEGNTAAPINRITYKVDAVRADGGLVVTPTAGGDQLVLPGTYVRKDVSLSYASTVHAAQGRTTDTAHAILGDGTDAAGMYVALTRGRDGNTAWTITRPVADDNPSGAAQTVTERTATAVLADLLESGQNDPVRTTLADTEHNAEQARSVRTAIDRLADGVARVTAGRVGRWLDQHTATGVLPAEYRERLAADQAMPALERLLRQSELAGHDPAKVLGDALAQRALDGARSAAQVVYGRITKALSGRLTPTMTNASDLVPADVPEQWREYLGGLADQADDRRRELGSRIAADQPAWAIDTLGPVPDEPMERLEWEERAGWAAAYRELSDHADESDPLGSAPPDGLSEHKAMFRAAHAALNMPDLAAEEAEASDGLLRARVRAAEREENWAPEYVAEQLEEASNALRDRQADAVLWSARAEVLEDADEAEKLRAAAAEAQREANELQDRIAELEIMDRDRAEWFVHTAVTRDLAQRAAREAARRGLDLEAADDRVTAEEWLAAHAEAMAGEDPHREVTEDDVADDITAEVPAVESDVVVETAVPDVRESVEDLDAVERAHRAVAELEQRRAADEAAEQAHRDQVAQWHHEEQHEQSALDDDGMELERL